MGNRSVPDYNFSALATKSGVRCSDGRIIGRNAFKCAPNGTKVPLVWSHNHDDPGAVLGHALLFNQNGDVRAHCYFNNTENGKIAKELVEHQDLFAVSIWANKLKQNGDVVTHGEIKELSLVLAGANPEARIDDVVAHEDGAPIESSYFCFNEPIEFIAHEDKEDAKMANKMTVDEALEAFDELDEESKAAMGILFSAVRESALNEAYEDDDDEDYDDEDEDDDDYDYEEDDDMKHSVFDAMSDDEYLAHQEEGLDFILTESRRKNESMKDTFLAHAEEYGISNIDYLFNEPTDINKVPTFIKRETDWVGGFMSATKHQPFSKIRTKFANITEDEARAKGYIKGKLKKEEVFSLLKRSTEACTIYKKQKFDRDDVTEITDFDVVAWVKTEMRMMLDEEIARAALIGDGRLNSDDDKIPEDHIRPIAKDADLFTIKVLVDVAADADDDTVARTFINSVIKNRRYYKGSGNPILYTTEEFLTDCLLLTDGVGRDLYESVDKLATKLRVSKIVTVPVMENAKGYNGKPLMAILVNPTDYSFGADKGGAVNMFDDFDIDYNQMKYLMETRCSGALTVPYSAMAFELDRAVG